MVLIQQRFSCLLHGQNIHTYWSWFHFTKRMSSTTTLPSNDVISLSNGVLMPRLGLGTWKLSDQAECSKAVKNCLEVQYKLIDTAPVYRNEQYIGAEIARFPGYGKDSLRTANGKGIFVSSKAGPHQMGFDKTYSACLETLENIGQTSIDLYLLHWPGVVKVPPTSQIHRKIRHESWKAMERLYDEGKARAIGVCNFFTHHLEGLIEDGIKIVPMVDQIEIHPLCPNWKLQETAKKLGIVLQAYSSLGSGNRSLLDHPAILEVAQKEKRDVTQVLLRWAIQQDITVIPRSTNLKHLKDNLSVLEWELSQESVDRLNRLCPPDQGASAESHFCWNSINIP